MNRQWSKAVAALVNGYRSTSEDVQWDTLTEEIESLMDELVDECASEAQMGMEGLK